MHTYAQAIVFEYLLTISSKDGFSSHIRFPESRFVSYSTMAKVSHRIVLETNPNYSELCRYLHPIQYNQFKTSIQSFLIHECNLNESEAHLERLFTPSQFPPAH